MDVLKIGKTIVHTLVRKGYLAYFAGGWVRDLLKGETSDEIDIATSAPPDKIVEIFDKTVTVGISFGVVVVIINGIHFEISTFRKDRNYVDGRHPEGVDFSSPEEDAKRRDFTINGMFYDPLEEKIIDYVGGREDLKKGVVRAIGDPGLRFREDRLRMVRAARFASRFGFFIEEKTQKEISNQAHELFPAVSVERIWQEFNKMATKGPFDQALVLLYKLQLLQEIFPSLKKCSLNEIQSRVCFFPKFPHECPTILYLLQLFLENNLEMRLEICQRLKTPTSDQKRVTFYTESEKLFIKNAPPPERVAWAHFYANSNSEMMLGIEKAKLPAPQQTLFDQKHKKQKEALAAHIKRIQEKKPLVNAALLQKEGIRPGRQLGQLLIEAQSIAINEDITDPSVIIEKLKRLPLW